MIGRSASATPTLATLYGAMNGITVKPANMSTIDERERAQVIAHAEDRRAAARAAARARRVREMRAQRRQQPRRGDAPTPTLSAASTRNGVRQMKCAAIHRPSGTPGDRRERERRGDDRGCASPGAQYGTRSATIASTSAADDAAEDAGDDARREQQRIVGREPAQRGRDDESGVEHEQRPLVVEAIDPERGDESARRGRERVRGHEQAELRAGRCRRAA